MIHLMATKISYWNANLLKLSDTERQVVEYGIEVFVDGFIKLMVLILLGVGLGRASESLCVIFVFCGLRYWAGGIHCKTNIGCLGAMILVLVMSVYGAEVLKDIPEIFSIIVMISCLGIIIWKAPGQTDYTPRLSKENERKKRRGAIVFVILLCIFIFLVEETYWKMLILLPMLGETLSIIPCKSNIINSIKEEKI